MFIRRPLYGLTGGVLVLLVRCLVVQDRTASAQAHLTIHALADALHITLRDLYTRHRHSLAQVSSPGKPANDHDFHTNLQQSSVYIWWNFICK